MHDLKELFSFSRGEIIALTALLVLALTGGGILLFERMQEQLPSEVVFRPIDLAHSRSAASSQAAVRTASQDSTENFLGVKNRSSANLRININTAPAESLMLLPHVGKVISARIIARRESHGKFDSPAELIAVRGIGPKYLQEILPFITAE